MWYPLSSTPFLLQREQSTSTWQSNNDISGHGRIQVQMKHTTITSKSNCDQDTERNWIAKLLLGSERLPRRLTLLADFYGVTRHNRTAVVNGTVPRQGYAIRFNLAYSRFAARIRWTYTTIVQSVSINHLPI